MLADLAIFSQPLAILPSTGTFKVYLQNVAYGGKDDKTDLIRSVIRDVRCKSIVRLSSFSRLIVVADV